MVENKLWKWINDIRDEVLLYGDIGYWWCMIGVENIIILGVLIF